MTDNTELKRLAEASLGDWYEVGELRCEDRSGYINGLHHDDEYFIAAANPAAVLALIAENYRLESEAEYAAAGFDAAREEVARLKSENEALLVALKGMTSMYGYCWDIVDGGLLCMQDNVQRFEDAHEAAQKVIAAMGKGGAQ